MLTSQSHVICKLYNSFLFRFDETHFSGIYSFLDSFKPNMIISKYSRCIIKQTIFLSNRNYNTPYLVLVDLCVIIYFNILYMYFNPGFDALCVSFPCDIVMLMYCHKFVSRTIEREYERLSNHYLTIVDFNVISSFLLRIFRVFFDILITKLEFEI